MAIANSIQSQLDEAEHIIRAQMARIAELEQENERLKEGLSAHGVLRSIYSDETQPTGHRIKAAIGAIDRETPRLTPQPPPLDLTAEEIIPLADLITQRRARQDALQGQDIEVLPSGAVRVLSHKPGSNGAPARGNGSDHS